MYVYIAPSVQAQQEEMVEIKPAATTMKVCVHLLVGQGASCPGNCHPESSLLQVAAILAAQTEGESDCCIPSLIGHHDV